MSKYLISTTEVYRVDSENEAKKLIEEAKADNHFVLSKYVCDYKEVKSKGEVIDSYFKVAFTKNFTDIKDPDCTATVSYDVQHYAFPAPVERNDDEGEMF